MMPAPISFGVSSMAYITIRKMAESMWLIDGGQSLHGDQWMIPDAVPQFPPYEID